MLSFFRVVGVLWRYTRTVRLVRTKIFFGLAGSVLSGASGTALVALVNSALKEENRSFTMFWSFVGVCVAQPLFGFVSAYVLTSLTREAELEHGVDLCRRIIATPQRRLEEVGIPRVLAALTHDGKTLASAFSKIPGIVRSAAVLIGCLGYMIYLSPSLSLLLIIFTFVGVVAYVIPTRRAQRHLRQAREGWDALSRHYRSLTEGSKELKLHRQRRKAFLTERVEVDARNVMEDRVLGFVFHALAGNWSRTVFAVLLGVLLFGASRVYSVAPDTLTGYTLAVLYLLGPLESLLALIPNLSRASVSVDKLEELGWMLEPSTPRPEEKILPQENSLTWERIELRQATFKYSSTRDSESFCFGPVDMTFGPGEIIFLVGGNGSGKTTLAKLIIGLYDTSEGTLCLDGVRIDDSNRDSYRQLFSVVLSDFYLFDSLLGMDSPDLDERARKYLVQLRIDHKVKIENGELSTVDLSQGQRKRLALLSAYLEDRPIYLFDEWAADQDPAFREVFYRQLLPELKSRGKTVLAISHDDRYYDVGDRILKLTEGRVEYDRATRPPEDESDLLNPTFLPADLARP